MKLTSILGFSTYAPKMFRELSTTELRELMQKPPAERTMRDILTNLKKIDVIGTRGQTTKKKWYLIEK